jgi:hypothetical protein
VHLRVHLIFISLAKKVDALAVDRSINVANAFNVDSCFFCASPMHSTQNCPSSPAFVECSMEQVNAFNDFPKAIQQTLFEDLQSRVEDVTT